MKTRLFSIVILLAIMLPAGAQKRLHFDLDYHYYLTMSEHFLGQSFRRGDLDKPHGNSLRFAVRYDITERVSAGAGIGVDWYNLLIYNTAPLYATCRYKLITKDLLKGLYAYTNLGYSIGSDNDGAVFTRGMMFDLGVGYPLMITKKFGINLQVGYNLSQFKNTELYVVDLKNPHYATVDRLLIDGCRHSLSFEIGITF